MVDLGYDLAAALPELRAQAESMMTDMCRITRGDGEPVWDDATGTYTTETETIYEGPCRLKLSSTVVRDVDAQGQLLAAQTPRLDLPISGAGVWLDYLAGLLPGAVLPEDDVFPGGSVVSGSSADVLPGDSAEILSSVNDPDIAGLVLTIEGRFFQTYATARRFPVEIQG